MNMSAPVQVKKDWNSLIREVISGEWRDPETGKACAVPFETIRIEETLEVEGAQLIWWHRSRSAASWPWCLTPIRLKPWAAAWSRNSRAGLPSRINRVSRQHPLR